MENVKKTDEGKYEATQRLTCAKQNDVDSDVGVQCLQNVHADLLRPTKRLQPHGLGCVQHDDDFLARRPGPGVELRIED